MFTTSTIRNTILAVAGVYAMLQPTASWAAVRTSAASDLPLSQRDLRATYSGKSWFWKKGVAYFDKNGRFYAWAGSDSKPAYVKGTWGAYKNGKICFSGNWRSTDGDGFEVTCFWHKYGNGEILQRREPDGKWYTFKNARRKKDGEYYKLVSGNHVSAKWKQIDRNFKPYIDVY